jgi:hypothetical protein
MGWVDGMGDETAVAARKLLGKAARDDARCGRRENGIECRKTVKLGKYRAFRFDGFRRVLLHQCCAVERVSEGRCDSHAGVCSLRVADQPLLGQIAKSVGDQCARALCNACAGVAERNVAAAAGKDDGPGAADEPGSDNSHVWLHIHNTLLLSARSPLSSCESPVQLTAPRSNTTARSESARTSSR